MNSKTVAGFAAAGLAPTVARRIGLRWIIFGVAAYYGLKLLNKKGILPKETDAALGFIDKGINLAKETIGAQASNALSGAKKAIHSNAPSVH